MKLYTQKNPVVYDWITEKNSHDARRIKKQESKNINEKNIDIMKLLYYKYISGHEYPEVTRDEYKYITSTITAGFLKDFPSDVCIYNEIGLIGCCRPENLFRYVKEPK